MAKLNSDQFDKLHTIVCDVLNRDDLAILLRTKLSDNIDNYPGMNGAWPNIVLNLIEVLDQKGKIASFLTALRSERPDNRELAAFEADYQTSEAQDSVPLEPTTTSLLNVTDAFSTSIREHMTTLRRHVERLTADQHRVIHQLRGVRRVRIEGCAGSGKTLIAAEKAIRLSNAGLRTLFLCHNPLLADHVRQLTAGSGVEVESFGLWVSKLVGEPSPATDSWSHLDEPDTATLDLAFDAVIARMAYDAVIVDEGQDFRGEWWTIAEAALGGQGNGLLYIFHDEQQAVLPFRGGYPIREPVLNLSRNCRNAGRVYELVRCLLSGAPSPEEHLKDLGEVLFLTYPPGGGRAAVEQAVSWIDHRGQTESLVAILGGIHLLEHCALAEPVPTRAGYDWKAEVVRMFHQAIRTAERVKPPVGGWEAVRSTLSGLSTLSYPDAHDLDLVRRVAAEFRLESAVRRAINNDPEKRGPLTWAIRDDRLILWKPSRPSIWASEIIFHFEQEGWHKGIPQPNVVRFVKHSQAGGPAEIPVYRTGDFKGLEADAVLFHIEGSVPLSHEELYVGISRARMFLALVVDVRAVSALPRSVTRFLSQHGGGESGVPHRA